MGVYNEPSSPPRRRPLLHSRGKTEDRVEKRLNIGIHSFYEVSKARIAFTARTM